MNEISMINKIKSFWSGAEPEPTWSWIKVIVWYFLLIYNIKRGWIFSFRSIFGQLFSDLISNRSRSSSIFDFLFSLSLSLLCRRHHIIYLLLLRDGGVTLIYCWCGAMAPSPVGGEIFNAPFWNRHFTCWNKHLRL